MPTTRSPASTSSAAAVALSTPPERATTIGGRLMSDSGARRRRARSMRYIPGVIKGAHHHVTIDALDDEGAGEGTLPGGALRLHVPFALPGEEVVATVEHASPHRPAAWGRLVE